MVVCALLVQQRQSVVSQPSADPQHKAIILCIATYLSRLQRPLGRVRLYPAALSPGFWFRAKSMALHYISLATTNIGSRTRLGLGRFILAGRRHSNYRCRRLPPKRIEEGAIRIWGERVFMFPGGGSRPRVGPMERVTKRQHMTASLERVQSWHT